MFPRQRRCREALLELAAMGLVEERPYSGTFVRHLDAMEVLLKKMDQAEG